MIPLFIQMCEQRVVFRDEPPSQTQTLTLETLLSFLYENINAFDHAYAYHMWCYGNKKDENGNYRRQPLEVFQNATSDYIFEKFGYDFIRSSLNNEETYRRMFQEYTHRSMYQGNFTELFREFQEYMHDEDLTFADREEEEEEEEEE
jgi:hypothetical protein